LLRALLGIRSVVVIRASQADGLAAAVSDNLLATQGTRDVALVCVDGPAPVPGAFYNALTDVPFKPDLALICTPAAAAVDALERAGQNGIRIAAVITPDPDGPEQSTPLKTALKDAARRSGCRFLGPGSVGINMPAIGLNASWTPTCPTAGKLALVSQSAMICASVVSWAAARSIGLSHILSLGDEADIDVGEALEFLAADRRTTSILLYLRSLSAARTFLSSARAAARIKPVLALKPREKALPVRLADALIDRDEVYNAVFHRAGLLRVSDTAEWFDAAETLGISPIRRGGKLAIISNGQGPADLACSIAGERLAKLQDKAAAILSRQLPAGFQSTNPLVLGRNATAENYAAALAALQDDPEVGALLIIYTPSPTDSSTSIARMVAEKAGGSSLAFLACWFGAALDDVARAQLTKSGVSLYDTPEKAARAFIHLDRHRRNQEALRQIPISRRHQLVTSDTEQSPSGRAAVPALLSSDELETTAFLVAYGRIWRAIKRGRTHLNVEESRDLLRAFAIPVRPFSDRGFRELPLSFAVVDDAVFGRIIVLTAAAMRTVVLPPLNRELTGELAIKATAAVSRATGIDLKAELLQDIVIHLADLAVEVPEVIGLETASVGLTDGNLVITEARIRVGVPGPLRSHLSIHPYPRELEERVSLKGGREMLIRPMKLEDIGLYHKMLNSVPKNDLLLRFCSVFGDLTQAIPTELLANLIHFDYSRDVTFIAIGAGAAGETIACGVVDAFVSPGREEAEYSILIHSDLAGTGLGKALMVKIISYCRAQGVGTLFGLILRNNRRMLGLCARLGFATATDDPEDDMVKMALTL
jgi:acetyltransferase